MTIRQWAGVVGEAVAGMRPNVPAGKSTNIDKGVKHPSGWCLTPRVQQEGKVLP